MKEFRKNHREIMIKRQQQYKKNNKEKIKQQNKEYREKNRDKIRLIAIKCWKKHPEYKILTPRRRFNQYKGGAKKRNKEFKITFEEFLSFWQKSCHYCGNEIKTIGLDRTDNKIGYEINNLKSCCFICNKMKGEQNEKEFLQQCTQIASSHQD